MPPARKYVTAVTHCLVTTASNKKQAEETGVYASVSLCFGPGDATQISQIHLIRDGNTKRWRLPFVEVKSQTKKKVLPVFLGDIGKEIADWAGDAMDQVKRFEKGKPRWNCAYRVAGEHVEIVKSNERSVAA